VDTELGLVLDVWSRLIARTRFAHRKRYVPPRVAETGGVLVAGAREDQIQAVERRLGAQLPLSYREFLLVSNGAHGGDAGLDTVDAHRWRHPVGWIRPEGLLPVEAIGPAQAEAPVVVDRLGGSRSGSAGGDARRRHRTRDHIADLAEPWSSGHTEADHSHVHSSILIGRATDPDTLMLLDPLTADGRGEWELWVVEADETIRYPSFGAWLVTSTERHENRFCTPDDARRWLTDPDASLGQRLKVVQDLIGVDRDTTWLTAQVELALVPGVEEYLQSWALGLLEWLDTTDGGDRYAVWVRRMLDDPLYGDVGLLEGVAVARAASPSRGPANLPTVAEIVARERIPDLRRLGRLPTDDLVALYHDAPDPILAAYLEERAHPLVTEPARVELEQLLPADGGYFRPEGRRSTPVGRSVIALTAAQILDLADRYDLDPAPVARALEAAGYPDDAVDHLDARWHRDLRLLYTLAEIDTSRAWERLDAAADHAELDVRVTALQAAARSRSPLLAPRAASLLYGGDQENLTALLALEIQATQLAADTLLTAWDDQIHWGALRALGRRRDPRILDHCLLLLFDPERPVRLVAAEVLRDLRHPDSTAAIGAALVESDDDQLTVVVAHTLAMFGELSASPLLAAKAAKTDDPQLVQLLTRWATQLVDGPS
jgi:hypothetical protein